MADLAQLKDSAVKKSLSLISTTARQEGKHPETRDTELIYCRSSERSRERFLFDFGIFIVTAAELIIHYLVTTWSVPRDIP